MKCPINYTVKEIVKIQANRGKQLEQLINHIIETLCKCRAYTGTVHNYIRNKGGNEQDSQDIIQESLLKLIHVLKNGTFRGDSSIENYAFGICKNIWKDKLKSYRKKNVMNKGIHIDSDKTTGKTPQLEMEAMERKEILWQIIDKLGPVCKKVLQLLALEFSHAEIAKEFDDWDEEKSRKQRSKCTKKLRDLIRKDTRLISLANIIR